ncbi:MAG: class I SAM-dependent methyltransferase, partial [Deltaproteobacteria bacterium]|nr:class I SAM-dependent methyltransferase [Deltaproteobacteria bacterium]
MNTNFSYEIDNDNPEEKKRFIKKLFDSIVPTYDLLNHILSMGTDMLWRRNIFNHIKDVRD